MSDKIQILHRYTDAVLFECDAPDDLDSGMRMRHALEQATAARANLDGAYLARANLARANLAGANLAEANLAGAYLAEANLVGANLAEANLAGANLAEANLAGANLAEAYLAGANLVGANLSRAKFGDAVTAKRGVRQVLGLRWTVTIFDAHMSIGCQMHSLADWADFNDHQIAEMDGANALRFWRQHKATLMALAEHGEVVEA